MSSLLTLNVLGATVGVGASASVTAGNSGSTGSSGSTGGSSGSTSPATPTTPTSSASPVAAGTSKATWDIQVGQTLYVNQRQSSGPSAWVPYKVVYVFGDGNAALVKEPDCVGYTGFLNVGSNLRRQGETYASDAQ